jgi:hypothetical protein
MRAFLAGCWFTHGDRLRERLSDGTYVLRCAQCGHDEKLLATEIVIGPQHQASEDLGRVKTKAIRVATSARGGRYDLGTAQPVSFARRK